MSRCAFLLLCAVMLIAGEPLPFPAGGMDQTAGSMPLGWTMPAWAQNGARRAVVEGNAVLNVLWPHVGHVWPTLVVPVDRRWAALRITLRVRVGELRSPAGGGAVLLRATFHRADGGVLAHLDSARLDRPTDWTTLVAEGRVPEGAVRLSVNPGFHGAAGTFDLDDLVVIPAWREAAPDPLPTLEPLIAAAPVPAQAPAVPAEAAAADPVPPAIILAEEADWGREPVEALTPVRGRMVLSGVWNLLPAHAGGVGTWGAIRVPGSWKPSGLPGIVRQGEGPAWTMQPAQLGAAWYARSFSMPAAWQGRSVELELTRFSTDAVVFLDGMLCGRLGEAHGSPAFGRVDLTPAVRPGRTQRLDILVSAGLAEREVVQMMGVGAGQQVRRKTTLPVCGLIGDAILHSRPTGAHVSDVFVQPSVRRGELRLDIELSGVAAAGRAAFVAEMLDGAGAVERRFEAEAAVTAAAVQTVAVTLRWPDARLWDFRQPNLYTLRLAATAPGLTDSYPQPFGFREFWIAGRDFMLNGTPFRLRPAFRGFHNGYPELIDSQIDADLEIGFNFQELWPDDPYDVMKWQDVVAERADRKGWPISGIGMPVQRLAASWHETRTQERFLHLMRRELRRLRNHPSIVMWGSSGNYFGHEQDQNPRLLGRQDWIPAAEQEAWTHGNRVVSRAIVARMKEEDPTRPVFMHAGTHVGDFPTANCYLNFTPLQEREEWPSDWAARHPLPWLAVEFGMPLDYSFLRGRGKAQVVFSERLHTEYLATMLGSAAYRDEPETFRRFHRDFFGDAAGANSAARSIEAGLMPAGGWAHSHMDVGSGETRSASYQAFMELHARSTWRSWRTWGLTSMPIPWTFPRSMWSYPGDASGRIALPPFAPGRRGAWAPDLPQRDFWSVPGKERTLTATARAVHEAGRATLAWIAGPESGFTAKDHAFWSGATIEKTAVLINDTRAPARFDLGWTAGLGGGEIARGRLEGELAVGEIRRLPLRIPVAATAKSDGAIELAGTIAGEAHADRFAFRVFPRPEPVRLSVAVHDPVGATAAMLTALGIEARRWDGRSADRLVVIGREALRRPPPADLQAFVAGGGRLLVMAQHPDWTRDALGLRVARHMSRRVFRIDVAHPVVVGLDDDDLRDWAGASTLVEAHPDAGTANTAMPYGWKWGNRGGLTSGAIEKPHHAGWRPLLECEFDLAYTPLMELDHGRGRMLWCTLDLEDYVPAEPAAVLLARQLFTYAAGEPPAPRLPEVAVLAGTHPLASLGVAHAVVAAPPERGLLVVPGDAQVDDAALRAFLARGGRAVLLPRRGASAPLGVALAETGEAGRAEPLPAWPELAGLSMSDLRTRGPLAAWTVAGGAESAAGGLLGRVRIGQGVAILVQADATALDVERQPWMRLARWRQTRVLTQILANLGAAFALDANLPALRSGADRVPLAGLWQVRANGLVKGSRDIALKPPITPISPAAMALIAPQLDDADWATADVPGMWSGFAGEMYGEAVFRRRVHIPAGWAGRDLVVSLGAVDDADITFWNGERIGSGEGWSTVRRYTIPGRLVRAGDNLLAVRVFNNYLAGGFNAKPDELHVAPAAADGSRPAGYYHADYRTDFDLGDEPYRYQRW